MTEVGCFVKREEGRHVSSTLHAVHLRIFRPDARSSWAGLARMHNQPRGPCFPCAKALPRCRAGMTFKRSC